MSKKELLKRIKYSLRFLPDKVYLQLYYFVKFKKFINFSNPKTYNEKLNWLKLHDRNPEYTNMVDKYEVKKYLSNIIGDEYIIPTLGIYDRFDDIDFDKLPNQFVIKCTHDSEGLYIVKDKKELNIEEARKKIETAMKYNFFYIGREWPYKNIKPRILIEEYIEDNKNKELRDYKFCCFSGKCKYMFISSERATKVKFTFFDSNGKFIDVKQCHADNDPKIELPKSFNKMKTIAKKISKDFINLRVDFYEVDGKIYIGELTFYDSSGFGVFEPFEYDYLFGSYIKIKGDK